MKLFNTLNRKTDEFKPAKDDEVSIYSCGPTVYDHIHIGNLSSFIYNDLLHRSLKLQGYDVKHIMNFTDVDDKTIRRSQERYPELDPNDALRKLTDEYIEIFLRDMQAIGNDVESFKFVRATDYMEDIKQLIRDLHSRGFAYVADDGVYFSIEKYRASGKKYGQLLELSTANTSDSRINNDEYDKDSVHDFALWKTKKEGEPSWQFELEDKDLSGRPGWHVECSVMSSKNLGQPFDIHTGGVDLIFPHHENEIAQSTALTENPEYARFFVHNEHLLVDGKKMSKSLNNFFTLDDIVKKGFEPLAFRLMILQGHYRNQLNFTWEGLQAAQNRLKDFKAWADLRFQDFTSENLTTNYSEALVSFKSSLSYDLSTPETLAFLNGMINRVDDKGFAPDSKAIANMAKFVDEFLGLGLTNGKDISDEQKNTLHERQKARDNKDWVKSDELRTELEKQGIAVRDTPNGQIWSRL